MRETLWDHTQGRGLNCKEFLLGHILDYLPVCHKTRKILTSSWIQRLVKFRNWYFHISTNCLWITSTRTARIFVLCSLSVTFCRTFSTLPTDGWSAAQNIVCSLQLLMILYGYPSALGNSENWMKHLLKHIAEEGRPVPHRVLCIYRYLFNLHVLRLYQSLLHCELQYFWISPPFQRFVKVFYQNIPGFMQWLHKS